MRTPLGVQILLDVNYYMPVIINYAMNLCFDKKKVLPLTLPDYLRRKDNTERLEYRISAQLNGN